MAATAAATDDVVLAGYFDLKLTGLDSLMFTDISGLEHKVEVVGGSVGSTTGAPADGRTVTTPAPMTLSMKHVVLATDDLWTWLDLTMTSQADQTAKKNGTLSLMPMGGTPTPQKTWNLDDVYLTSVSLEQMGASGSAYLTATIGVLVGSCLAM